MEFQPDKDILSNDLRKILIGERYCNNPGIPTIIKTMGVNITTIVYLLPKGFNHPNWVNHYFNGGGSPGIIFQVVGSEIGSFFN